MIQDIEELKDGESYVCASFEKFHRIKYGQYSKQNHMSESLDFFLWYFLKQLLVNEQWMRLFLVILSHFHDVVKLV